MSIVLLSCRRQASRQPATAAKSSPQAQRRTVEYDWGACQGGGNIESLPVPEKVVDEIVASCRSHLNRSRKGATLGYPKYGRFA